MKTQTGMIKLSFFSGLGHHFRFGIRVAPAHLIEGAGTFQVFFVIGRGKTEAHQLIIILAQNGFRDGEPDMESRVDPVQGVGSGWCRANVFQRQLDIVDLGAVLPRRLKEPQIKRNHRWTQIKHR